MGKKKRMAPPQMLFFGIVFSVAACANGLQSVHNVQLDAAWGDPEYAKYGDTEKVDEWRYTRPGATLSISHTECPTCTDITPQSVDAHSQDPNSQAVLVMQNNIPGILRFTSSPKGVNFMIYEFYRAGVYYSVQMGLANTTSLEASFELQKEFLANIQSLKAR